MKSKVDLIIFLGWLASLYKVYLCGIYTLKILVEIVLIWAFHVTFLSINYLLNVSSCCFGSISWCCFIVPLFHCTTHVPLFRGIPIVPPVFRWSVCAPVFRQRSGVPLVFRVPQFRVPVFLVLQYAANIEQKDKTVRNTRCRIVPNH